VSITSADIVPLNKVRAKLDYCHQLERERSYNAVAEDILRGLDDMDAGRTISAQQFRKNHAARLKCPAGNSTRLRAGFRRRLKPGA
jgi:hypothetical protein